MRIETPYLGAFVDALKASVPSAYRTYDTYSKRWTVFKPHVQEARRLTKAYFDTVTENDYQLYEQGDADERQRRAEDARRRTNTNRNYRDDQHTGFWNQFGQQQAQGNQTPAHYRKLFVQSDAPQVVVDASYKALARFYHPDLNRGKDTTADMQAVNAAYDQIKREKGWN